MSAVWYTGRANSRTISVAEWASVGVTVAQPTVWDKSNGYSLPQSGFSPTQLTILDNNENFQTNAADGPRTGAIPQAIPRSQALAKLSDLDDLQAVVNYTFARPRKPTVVLFGDSRTAMQDYSDAAGGYSTQYDWFGFGQYAATGGPALEIVKNSGIVGNTTTQMLARMDADVIAYAPGYMTLWGGTNDGWTTTAHADATYLRMVQMIEKARAAGIYVFLVSEISSTKNSTFPGLVLYFNERLRKYAQGNPGVEYWDFYAQIVNPTDVNGYPIAALMLADGLHLSASGASKLGKNVVGPALSRLQSRTAALPASVNDSMGTSANSRNVVSNPLMTSTGGTLGSGDTGTLPGSWGTTSSANVSAVASAPARADGFGNDLQLALTATAAGPKWTNQTVTPARITPGETYVLECGMDIVSPVSLGSLALTLQVTVSGTAYEFGMGKNHDPVTAGESLVAATGLVLRSRPFVVPAGTVTAANLLHTARFGGAGSATVRMGRVSLKKVSDL